MFFKLLVRFEKVVYFGELKRFGGAYKESPFAPIISSNVKEIADGKSQAPFFIFLPIFD
jgi:hypothetical protein